MGFHDSSPGSADVYLSGSFNDWGGTLSKWRFVPRAEWKMRYNRRRRRYELTVPLGRRRPMIVGSEFKFTVCGADGVQWYPAENLYIGLPEALYQVAAGGESLALHRGTATLPDDRSVHYHGNDLGHSYSPEATRFRIWAPEATAAAVCIYSGPAGGAPRFFPLSPAEGGTWATLLPGDWNGYYYSYALSFGRRTVEVADPYAVGAGVNGERALILDLRETDPPGWESDVRPPLAAATDAIIYETHIRDISVHPESGIQMKGKFLGLAERGARGPGGVATGLDHLAELGVTHLHLLPVFDFASVDERRPDQYNWGYDPKHYNVPEGSYATDPNGTARIREFKQMVLALHRAGLRVVMDVVYNHTFHGASPFEKIAPYYYYRHDAYGRMANGSGCGNEIASERAMVRKFIVDSVRFWATEYHVDGFRFDLMALHDVETMRQVRAALDAIDSSILVYGEPWTGGPSLLDPGERMSFGRQQGMRIALYNDRFRSAIKGDNDGLLRGFATGAWGDWGVRRGVVGSVDYGGGLADFAREPGETVNYVSCHDNLTLWDKIAASNQDESEADRLRMDLLAQAIILTSQGIPFLHSGEEMLRTKGMNHNSYRAPDHVNWLDWTRKERYAEVFRYYQGLIRLRRAHPAFRLRTAAAVRRHLHFLDSHPGTVAFWLKGRAGGDRWRHIAVVYNPLRHPVSFRLPVRGRWQVAACGMQVADGPIAPPVSGRAEVPPLSMMLLYRE
jgi:pullulanase